MDEAAIEKFQNSLKNMRAKVVAAKGEAVKGLSKVMELDTKTVSPTVKTREAKA